LRNNIAEQGHCEGGAHTTGNKNDAVKLSRRAQPSVRPFKEHYACLFVRGVGIADDLVIFGCIPKKASCAAFLCTNKKFQLIVFGDRSDGEWVALQWRNCMACEKQMLAWRPFGPWVLDGNSSDVSG
jgi:hypothetical protein